MGDDLNNYLGTRSFRVQATYRIIPQYSRFFFYFIFIDMGGHNVNWSLWAQNLLFFLASFELALWDNQKLMTKVRQEVKWEVA